MASQSVIPLMFGNEIYKLALLFLQGVHLSIDYITFYVFLFTFICPLNYTFSFHIYSFAGYHSKGQY